MTSQGQAEENAVVSSNTEKEIGKESDGSRQDESTELIPLSMETAQTTVKQPSSWENGNPSEVEVKTQRVSLNEEIVSTPASPVRETISTYGIDHISYDKAVEQLIEMPRGTAHSSADHRIPTINAPNESGQDPPEIINMEQSPIREILPKATSGEGEMLLIDLRTPHEKTHSKIMLEEEEEKKDEANQQKSASATSRVIESIETYAVDEENSQGRARELTSLQDLTDGRTAEVANEGGSSVSRDAGTANGDQSPFRNTEEQKTARLRSLSTTVVLPEQVSPLLPPLVETQVPTDISLRSFHGSPQSNREPLLMTGGPVSDEIELLPPIEQRPTVPSLDGSLQPRVYIQQPLQPQRSFGYLNQAAVSIPTQSSMMNPSGGGRRKIRLHLQQDIRNMPGPGFLGHFRQRSRNMFGHSEDMDDDFVDRGRITVSWFEGTTSQELQEHVRRSAVRKLKLQKQIELTDLRFVDGSSDPPEEIVLSTYIPDGSEFVLQFSLTDTSDDGLNTPAPESPSAAPSPHPKNRLAGLNANQLALLKMPSSQRRPKRGKKRSDLTESPRRRGSGSSRGQNMTAGKDGSKDDKESKIKNSSSEEEEDDRTTDHSFEEDMSLHREDPIEARLRQITQLLVNDRDERKGQDSSRRREKRQVIFVLANYFVLFLSLIAISAEIQARAPDWLNSLEKQMRDVQDCASDKEALFQCVTNGDFAGLVASVTIWLTRSAATSRIFTFGFETTQKLWTVVYESLVTAVCWGVSYLFIRRAMNPDTRTRFLHKYWKDAVYGSLAGFNASFMKQVLKNLIPQEAVEDVLRERQLKILTWLPSFE